MADKRVYSGTLQTASSARTRIERTFDPESIRRFNETATLHVSVGGSNLAPHAFTFELVDDIHLYLAPLLVGAGKRASPDKVHQPLNLMDER